MTTLSDTIAWLKKPTHIRRILVEVDSTYYFSNGAYTSFSGDSPANKSYLPIISGGVSFTESIALDGSLSISYGDIELNNTDGKYDSYLLTSWLNKPIVIYLGDPSWPKADFKVLYRGLVNELLSRDRNTLNIVLVDKLQKLNTAISTTVANSDKNGSLEYIPVTFGECFNVTPRSTSTSLLRYQVHSGQIEDIIEVRDNGAPVSITKNLSAGTFTLAQAPYGQITCSVQGSKPQGNYSNQIGTVIKDIVKNYGPQVSRLSDSDIDLDNLAAFNSYAIGVYCSNGENILDVCNQIASSIRAKLNFSVGPLNDDSKVGLLKLVQLTVSGAATYTITEADIEERSLSISDRSTIRANTKIAYCKNWTVQQRSGLAEGLSSKSKGLMDDMWLYSTVAGDSTIASNYKLTLDPPQEDTLLLTLVDANTEAAARNTIFQQQRTIYNMTGYPHLLGLQLGDRVNLINRRFNLSAGAVGTVVSVSRDWILGRITLGVLV